VPEDAGKVAPIYRRLSRWSAAFALTADMAFLTLGGALKRKEMISARLGDALSEMYLIAAALKRWEDEGRNDEDLPLVQHAADTGFARIGQALDETIANMPAKWVGWLLRPILRPGAHPRGPSDAVKEAVAKLVYEPGAARDRLVNGYHPPKPDSGLGLLDTAFRLVIEAEPITRRLRTARKSPQEARRAGILSDAEFNQLERVEEAVRKVVAVDDYAPEDLARLFPEMPRRPTWQEAAE
jgi:acyl-CoA dehydrogenase